MKPIHTTIFLSGSGLAVALIGLGLAGCSSVNSPFERSTPREDVASSVDDAAAQVAEVKGRVNDAVRDLDDLTNHPAMDLQRQYDAYHGSVNRFESATTQLRQDTEAMERKGREYLEAWDRDIATIHNEDLRKRTADRRDEVANRIEELHDSYLTAREKLGTLERRLNDVESALKVDLTPGGIKAVQPTISNVKDAVDPAQNALQDLAGALRRAAVAFAPENARVPNAAGSSTD